jgi:hypothetical protein
LGFSGWWAKELAPYSTVYDFSDFVTLWLQGLKLFLLPGLIFFLFSKTIFWIVKGFMEDSEQPKGVPILFVLPLALRVVRIELGVCRVQQFLLRNQVPSEGIGETNRKSV